MEVNTRIFGMINIEDDKLIHFVNGIVGFPELTTFALIHDNEKNGGIQWLQSMQEPQFAIPVMNPLDILDSYNPQVEDELLKPIGGIDTDSMLVLVTVAVPSDLTKMSVNLRGPIVINSENRKACQVITEGEEYQVKFPIYDILKERKAGE